jgi:prolyl oligopeptidase
MKQNIQFATLCCVVSLLFTSPELYSQKPMFVPPTTPQRPVTEVLHSTTLTDPFQWLEDKSNPEVIDWTKKQHDATIKYVDEVSKKYDGLAEELTEFIDRDITTAPSFQYGREYFYSRKKGEQQSKLFTRLDGKEILIFDPIAIDPSGKTAITSFQPKKNSSIALIATQKKGDEINVYRIIDTKTGKVLGAPIENAGGISFCREDGYVYFSPKSRETIDKQIPQKVFKHKIGTPHSNDVLLTSANDAKDFVSVYDPNDANVTVYSAGDFYSNTVKLQRNGIDKEPKEIYSSKQFKAYIGFKNEKMYIFTNHNAPKFKIMVADLKNPEFANWKDLIPESEAVLEGYDVTDKHIIVQEKTELISKLKVYTLDGTFVRVIEFPEIGTVAGVTFDEVSKKLYASQTSFTSPSTLYIIDEITWKLTSIFKEDVKLNTNDIESKMVYYPSKDGTKIPMYLVYKKGLKLDGNNPTMLYGYGGFNVGISPRFIGTTASFIQRGGVYAWAGLRGGDEFGEEWHKAGMMDQKQNVFDDCISAAEYLIKEKYTNPQRLALKGGSNGGLLVGAVLTQRPDLFKVGFCLVPLLDMVRYHKFLIARYWIPEYGDPDKAEDFGTLLQYSPYHNIKYGVSLPTMFVSAGENDTRVDPLHAKKFVAMAQQNPSQKNPILLHIEYDSGHGSGKSVQQVVEGISREMRFMMTELGM